MSPDTHRQALLAAARVACAAALISCAPKTSSAPAPESLLPAALATCDATLAAVFPAKPMPRDDAEQSEWDTYLAEVEARRSAAREQPEVIACCSDIAVSFGADIEAAVGWTEREDCCEVLNWQGSTACTPWGPPTPPAMPEEVA